MDIATDKWLVGFFNILTQIQKRPMKRSISILCLVFLTITYAFSLGADKRPNVIFIVCDDLNTHVSTSGYPHIQTPAFEKLASSGITFKRAYCQYPVCGPSRASFLSGLYPESTGVTDNNTDMRDARPATVTMPQAFKEQGYWTAATGKVFHNPKMDPGELVWNEKTFFRNDEMPLEAEARKAFEAEHGSVKGQKKRELWKEFQLTYSTQTRGQAPGYGPSGLEDHQHKDGKNVAQVLSWLDQRSFGAKPFFIAVGIHKPHVPFLAPQAYFDLYPRQELNFVAPPPDFWDHVPNRAMVKRYEGFGFELGVENDALRREYMQAYHACVSFIDVQIGAIFDKLRATDLWEDTVIVLTSDHGYQLGEHFMWGKVTLFEICNRVPLIIRAPGITKPNSVSQGLTELVDLFPTLAELCGIATPGNLQGRSLVPMLKDANAPGKKAVYTVVTRGQNFGKAIRTIRWRYARWPDGEELYDLTTDTEEHANLAGKKSYAALLKTMRGLMHEAETKARSAAPSG